MRHILTTLLLGTVLAVPAAIQAEEHAREQRYYDPYARDYHHWNENEERAYRHWLQEQHREYHTYNRANHREQREYWRWRHEHPEWERR